MSAAGDVLVDVELGELILLPLPTSLARPAPGPFAIRVENHRDRYCTSIPPTLTEKYIGARWIDKGPARTVLTIVLDPDDGESSSDACFGRTIPPGRKTAVISLEDISWQLVIKGDVQGGQSYTVFIRSHRRPDLREQAADRDQTRVPTLHARLHPLKANWR